MGLISLTQVGFLKVSQLLCVLHFVVRMQFAVLPAYLELDCDPSFLAWRPSIVRIKNLQESS